MLGGMHQHLTVVNKFESLSSTDLKIRQGCLSQLLVFKTQNKPLDNCCFYLLSTDSEVHSNPTCLLLCNLMANEIIIVSTTFLMSNENTLN